MPLAGKKGEKKRVEISTIAEGMGTELGGKKGVDKFGKGNPNLGSSEGRGGGAFHHQFRGEDRVGKSNFPARMGRDHPKKGGKGRGIFLVRKGHVSD